MWVREQHGKISARQFANTLSCEALLDDQVPWRFRKAVTEFRHLHTDKRVAACRAYLEKRPAS